VQKQLKKELREKILTLLIDHKEKDRTHKGLIIRNKLLDFPEFKKASIILLYASIDGEVDTFEIIKQALKLGKTIALPKIKKDTKEIIPVKVEHLENDLVNGSYGIKEPNEETCERIELDQLDMVVVPGIAFDYKHNRLGRGGGYYDRFLNRLPQNIYTIGLAFDFQMVESLPQIDSYDAPVNNVLTN